MEIILYNEDYKVYKNIPSFCKCRGIELQNYEDIDIKEFNIRRNLNGYFIYRGPGVSIVHFSLQGDSHKKQKNIKILNTIDKNDYIITIVPDSIKFKNNSGRKMEILSLENYFLYDWKDVSDKKGNSVELVSKEDITDLRERFYIFEENIPVIPSNTHEVVWYGFKKNDIIKISYPSMASSGTTATLRRVVD